MFCQERCNEQLHSVQSFNTSKKIIDATRYDHKLSLAFAGICDLIASEGKYHLKCYANFLRDTTEVRDTAMKNNLAMAWLCTQLKESVSKGHVLELEEVWKYYKLLCTKTDETVPKSFISKRATFKDKVESLVKNVYGFHTLSKSEDREKGIVLLPIEFSHIPIATLLSHEDEECVIPVYTAGDDIFLSLIHVALKLRSDIVSHPPYKGLKVTKEAAMSCIPESLYMFLTVMYGGQCVLWGDEEEGNQDENDDEITTGVTSDRIISVAQDLVYGTSNGKMWTPKHVGLGSTLHQSTRSKHLVQLFHNAGHTISYKNVLQVDTALAEFTTQSLNSINGAIVPENLVSDRFVHFSTDNIDILDASLDGKNTFHATQLAAWQRGPSSETKTLETLLPSQKTLIVPDVLTATIPPDKYVSSPEPKFENDVHLDWFLNSEEQNPHKLLAEAKDLAFNIRRQSDDPKRSWSHYNQENSLHDPLTTTIGYMPLILSPAHEYETLNTVIVRCKHIAEILGQEHVVLTADEALFSRLMELKWSQDYSFLIPKMGGLHISMNFMKALGKHFEATGLLELWTESGLLGQKNG